MQLIELALLDPDARAKVLDRDGIEPFRTDWHGWRQPGQRPPDGSWSTWMMLAGRGFGKTRAGAEWVRELAEARPIRIALVAGTLSDAREVMIDGESGLRAIAPAATRPAWEATRGRLVWPSGAEALVYSAETPERLRGPEHHFAWCDELAKWAYPQATWDNLQLGLRLGSKPRTTITTTPRPIALLKALIANPRIAVTRGGTMQNGFLPEAFTEAVTALYAGTRLGRQELDGELIEDLENALWTRDAIEACRANTMPAVRRVVIGVDPPAGTLPGAGGGGDACGIVVVALGDDGLAHVIEDASVNGRSPEGWARAVADAAARHGADRVIAEANNGGAMVESVLRAADARLPVKRVHAAHGKSARAEPVAALYAHGRVKHLGAFPALEDELCGLIAGGGYEGPGRSPDRADALVWALWELMLGRPGRGLPQVRVV